MPGTLSKELRNKLAKTTADARKQAEAAALASLENLAVHEAARRKHMEKDPVQSQLRSRLRARGLALGDLRAADRTQCIQHLVELVAYEAWHRLLFTRFLTENNLLHTIEDGASVPVSLQECHELAPERGARDGFDLACRFAQEILPGVFRSNDPALELPLSISDEVALRKLVNAIPTEVFTASDALGWTYQFWQAEKKDAVNAAGNKIGADELPAVTQLFTEDYMVDFLLDNTLGAWHAGKVLAVNPKLAKNAQSEEELRQAVALPGCPWKYLRFTQDNQGQWTPAAGTFDGWPKTAKELKCLDPCMGSGHFVVAMFERLVALRLAEEKLDESAAVAVVIQDNLFGLEIDPRCTQIAAFNLALAAWRRVGYCPLPAMNLACSGLAPNTRKADWLTIAGEDEKLRNGMERLYRLFENAPVLGSLINPRKSTDDMYVADFHVLQPLLEKALAQETQDDTAHEMAVTARGLAKAAEILAGQFTLVATNVPYLGQGKQDEVLQEYAGRVYPNAKADLATCFVERCIEFCGDSGITSLVTPQNWFFLGSYKTLRRRLLETRRWLSVARLGTGAFGTISGEVVNVSLVSISKAHPPSGANFFGVDVSTEKSPAEKASGLVSFELLDLKQSDQIHNPDSAVVLGQIARFPALSRIADVNYGSKPGQTPRVTRSFWELGVVERKHWRFMESSPAGGSLYSGKAEVCLSQSEIERQSIVEFGIRGSSAWGKRGVIFAKMSQLSAAVYVGEFYDDNTYTIIPKRSEDVAALFVYVASDAFYDDLRRINQKLNVTRELVEQLPFDLAHWQKVAAEKYPHGLPKPFSSDPTQWLFNGHPAGADQPLQVAVARLLGYQWPRQTGSSFSDCPALGPDGLETLADADGIVCLPPINREQPAVHRLRQLLAAALGNHDEKALILHAGGKGKATNLEDWLRDEFFEQHCALFHHRPFIWHLWDGRKDGFHALVNYHKLDHAALKKLTFTYLGEWITVQRDDVKADKPGAAERLGAAEALQKQLEAILEGEAPLDLFVRWKPISQQAIGWNPDLNDGVRLNIRPFLLAEDVGKKGAGILRAKPNIKWDKDRGKEPERPKADFPWFWCEDEPEGMDARPGATFTGHRWNSVHLSLQAKRQAQG